MFRNLLVPLDGSPMAEAALPAAVYLAPKLPATITLLHILEREAPPEVHGHPHLRTPEEAQRYFDGLIQTRLPKALRVESHVHTSEVRHVPPSIEGHAADLPDCLVIMCTHGRSGLGSLMLGTLAQRVVAEGTTPVLLVPPDGPPEFRLRRLLVPLDGEEVHERALPVARELARACAADLHLVLVVPTRRTLAGAGEPAARLLPRTTDAMLRIAQEEGREYLGRQVACWQAGGLAVTSEIRQGDPSATIIDAARRSEADLIALATHRKAGLDAFWSGSVAPRVASYAKRSVLLVPIAD